MLLNFIEAADGTPLTKTFFLNENGKVGTKPYPFVRNFNSYDETVESLQEFYDALVKHAHMGRCLVKGRLKSELNNQPRAGETDAFELTDYIVLDLDFADGFEDVDQFLSELDPKLNDVSYIFQHSSSSGIKCEPGLRGHIFIQLEHPQPPSMIKQWLIDRNLKIPALRQHASLSANGMALKWPLDVTTCQNDKLIYIAEPNVNGVQDTLQGKRFELRTKNKEATNLLFSANIPLNNQNTLELVEELRKAHGLKKRAPKYKTVGHHEILTNPEVAQITGIQEARGFVYLNLNGGDSWGYYYNPKNPQFLHNFKGEPSVRLKDIVPEYYREIKRAEAKVDEREYFAVRDVKSDSYFAGYYETGNRHLEIDPISSKDKIRDFFVSKGLPEPDVINDWDVVFDPMSDVIYDTEKQRINTMKFTEHMYEDGTTPAAIPRTIDKVLSSICGDDETKTHFINWLASAFQTRKKATTSWIFSGVQGTGKGIFLNKVIRPLFGDEQVCEILHETFDEQFNAFAENALMIWIDEFSVNNSNNQIKSFNKLKNLVTEEHIMIRRMRSNAVQRRFYANIILATNHPDPIPLGHLDRRFHVAPPQEHPIQITQQEVESIKEELPMFAAYLRRYQVNAKAVNTIRDTDARKRMIEAGQTSVQRIFDALVKGNLDFFMQFIQEKAPLEDGIAYSNFHRAVKRWAANFETEMLVTFDEIRNVYYHLQGQKKQDIKFQRMLDINRVNMVRRRVNGKPQRGILVTFATGDKDEIAALIEPDIREVAKSA